MTCRRKDFRTAGNRVAMTSLALIVVLSVATPLFAGARLSDASQSARAEVFMDQQVDPAPTDLNSASPDQLRERTREVMERKEFRYEKSWLERFMTWLGEKLRFDADLPGATGVFNGGVGALIAWLLIVFAVVGIVAAIVYAVVKRTPRDREEETEVDAVIERRKNASEWLSEAEVFESLNDWKNAILARYRLLIRTLVDRGQLPDVPGRTTGELRSDLDRTTPDARDAFDTATLLFELPWYADVETGPEENRQFRDLAEEILAFEVVDRGEVAASERLVTSLDAEVTA